MIDKICHPYEKSRKMCFIILDRKLKIRDTNNGMFPKINLLITIALNILARNILIGKQLNKMNPNRKIYLLW